MVEAIGGFDWDRHNIGKCAKHGVTPDEIEQVFGSDVAMFPDAKHSSSEARFLAIGTTRRGRYVFIAYTVRQRDQRLLIRPISARYMHRKEIDHYEKETAAARKR